MNKLIIERIGFMLSNAKLPKSFWGGAMRTVVDLINFYSSITFYGDIPKRVWTRKDMFFKHLRVFYYNLLLIFPNMRDQIMRSSPSSVFYWVMDMRNLAIDH